MGLVGHATIKIVDTEGFVRSYVQMDNSVIEEIKECMFDVFSALAALGVICNPGVSLQIGGDGSPTTENDNALNEAYVNTNLNEANYLEVRDAKPANNAGSVYTADFLFNGLDDATSNPIGCSADGAGGDPNPGNGLDFCVIAEVVLEDAGNNLVAHAVVTAVQPVAEAGFTVFVNYDIDLV